MSDIVSLELLFDDATEARIRAEWATLQELGVSSMGAHASVSNRPHLSLLVRSASSGAEPGGAARDVGDAAKPGTDGSGALTGPLGDESAPSLLDLEAVRDAASRLPMPLTLGGPQLFRHGARAVLARSVAPSLGLLEFHAELHRLAGSAEGAVDLPHTTPGKWTPHVTLAKRLKLADLEQAVATLDFEPRHALATGLRLWDARSRTVKSLRIA